ncbi:lipid A export permease/ATP-binding protein MsbA [Comamonas sp. Y6]|uniref:Lipid A export permease/ATP-binding protein MsbA n=2 Tax=Comamonas resistens TaxID=3046670 RepID=A0ABY8SXV1_9BURK|nr:lipid A export permease/ATP-binding protein MsbA [Comamonas resistens]MDL5036790.1 lipid A export permease/ATP-binding protein MsbA [Comamonas resistens]WHS67887.1 lipid A export permease/ATP-binding protein MsbA [Comamonas resistens]
MQRLKRLTPYFSGQRWAWGLAIFATLIGAATEPAMPALLKPLLDSGFTAGSLPLWTVPVFLIGLFVIRGLAQFAGQYALARITNDGMLALRQKLFERLLAADMSLFSRQSASALSNTIVYEVQTGAQQLVQAMMSISRDGFTLIALLGYLIYLNWQLTLIVAFMVPGVAWVMKTLSRRLYRITKSSQTATDQLAYVVEENVLAHRMVRLHGAQQSQQSRFSELSRQLRGLNTKATIASAAMTPLTQVLASIALSVILCIALWQSREDGIGAVQDVTVGGFAAFISAMLMLIAPIRRMADVANPITRGVAALERGLSLLEGSTDEQGGSFKPTGTVSGALQLSNVSVQFGEDKAPALSRLSLSIKAGEVVALVGPSGAGKTTLVNLLPRFLSPTSGQITLDGVQLPEWDLNALRQQFALVSQDVVMLNDSVAANVALGADIDEARIWSALEAANLGDFVRNLPQGLHTLVGHNASQLSGGQRQRLAIARALYKNAPILILDEATSALDNESERLVQEALNRLMQGRTTIVIAHRLSTIEHADRVVVMERGQIAEQGSHAELMDLGGLYARLHNQVRSATPGEPQI